MPYEPKSLDLTRVQIPADLNNLVEQLSEITHDNWLKQRLADGWRHGVSRNDLLKEHPCIVSYDDLPESEKEYDRKISQRVQGFACEYVGRIPLPKHAGIIPLYLVRRSNP